MTAFAQSTKNSGDTICLPKEHALKVLESALNGKVYKEQRDSLVNVVSGLDKLIEVKNDQIKNLKSENVDYAQLVANYEKQKKELEDQKNLAQGFITSLNKEVKKQKRRATVIGLMGILASAAAFYIGSR